MWQPPYPRSWAHSEAAESLLSPQQHACFQYRLVASESSLLPSWPSSYPLGLLQSPSGCSHMSPGARSPELRSPDAGDREQWETSARPRLESWWTLNPERIVSHGIAKLFCSILRQHSLWAEVYYDSTIECARNWAASALDCVQAAAFRQ